jgi:hypothetical protein
MKYSFLGGGGNTPLFSSGLHYMVTCNFIFKKNKPLLKIGTTNLTLRPTEMGAAIAKGTLGKPTDRGVTHETAEVCSENENAELTQKRRALFHEFQIHQLKHLT